MVAKLYAVGRISDIEVYKEGILAREAQTSTGLVTASQCLMPKQCGQRSDGLIRKK